MHGRSEKLKDNQALLLMYIADELSPPDRAQVEARLKVDEVLQAQLEELHSAHETFLEAMGWLDSTTPPISEQTAGARAGRAIRQWSVERLARPALSTARKFAVPTWVYPMAVAAAIIVAVTLSVERYEQNLGSTPPANSLADNSDGRFDDTPTTDASDATAAADSAEPDLFDDAPSTEPALDKAEGAIAAIPSTEDVNGIVFLDTPDVNVQGGVR
jgi:hypothetical protein